MTSDSIKPNILVVDNNDLSRKNIVNFCNNEGCKVYTFDSVNLAISSIADNSYDLIITDYEFPELNREELFKALTTNSNYKIIVLSDSYSVEEAISTIKLGANDFLRKPVNFQKISDCLNEIKSDNSTKNLKSHIEKFSFSFEFKTEEIVKFKLFEELNFIFEDSKLDKQKLLELKLAFQEALTNAIEHGNLELDSKCKDLFNEEGIDEFSIKKKKRLTDSKYKDRKIFLDFEVNSSFLKIKIKDEGSGFLNKKEVSNFTEDELKPYGRGMQLIHQNTDEVKFLENGKLQILIKNI